MVGIDGAGRDGEKEGGGGGEGWGNGRWCQRGDRGEHRGAGVLLTCKTRGGCKEGVVFVVEEDEEEEDVFAENQGGGRGLHFPENEGQRPS